MDVEQELRAILKKKLKEGVELDPATKLAEAGLDSLDVVEIVFDIEDKFKIQLPQFEGEAMASVTFRDISTLVEQQLAAKEEAASGAQPAA